MITIIGAGIGGLTTALALQHLGLPATLYERSPALTELGAGITLAPNAVRVLDWLGVDVRPFGVSPTVQLTQHWQTGEVLRTSSRGADFAARHGGAGYYHVHRADLQTAMLATLKSPLHLAHTLQTITPGGQLTFTNTHTAQATTVIAADGVRSAVRAALWPSSAPHFTGQVAWRGLVPRAALPPAQQALPPGIHIGPGRLFLRYPVRNSTLINYAAFVETPGWFEEGWTIPSTIPELLTHFEGWDPLVTNLITATPEGNLFKWALHAHTPLKTWTKSWTSSNVTLLGDAAHAMLPFMGQGAATAIEDAAILARCLAKYPAPQALATYEANRRPIATLIQTQSRLLGLQLQGKNPETLNAGPLLNEETMGLFTRNAVLEPV